MLDDAVPAPPQRDPEGGTIYLIAPMRLVTRTAGARQPRTQWQRIQGVTTVVPQPGRQISR
jgi:hypothetical protein